ncbi:MAG: 4Fe-4S dicluster domain-containing protein [Candidatus Korarchaeum sp.]
MTLSMTEKPIVVAEDISREFLRLGGEGIRKCYQCGTCTAICPNSEIQTVRVRRLIKKIQLGMRSSILGDPTPWTCYFCGDCNATCPREATPGYIMDSARKYQVINYSFLKLGKIFYEKLYAAIALMIMTLVGILGIFTWSHGLSELDLARVNINTFMSSEIIHEIGLWLLAYTVLVSLANIITMYSYMRGTLECEKRVKLSTWIKELVDVILKEGLFQLRLRCQKGFSGRYLAHLSIFWGFVLTFAATGVHFIWLTLYPEVPEPPLVTNTARVLGIIGGILLMYGSVYYLLHRIKKDDVYAERTYLPDWWLLSLILVIGLSGFLITTAIYVNIPLLAYASYGVHLLTVFYLIISAPFSKLAHLIYRPLALWFAKVWEGEL